MSDSSTISGIISGITKEDYLKIRKDLKQVFESVEWDNTDQGTLGIYSYGKHDASKLGSLCFKIASIMQLGGEGQLDVEGDDSEDLSTIFFIPGEVKQEYATIIYPDNPFTLKEPYQNSLKKPRAEQYMAKLRNKEKLHTRKVRVE